MASAASGDEAGVANPPQRTRREKKKKEQSDKLANFGEEIEDTEPLLDEVKETRCVRHGNVRQRTRHGMKYTMYAASFSPDGKFVLTASQDKSVCIWDLALPIEAPPVANYEHPDIPRCAVYSPDGTHICTGCDDREARVYEVKHEPLISVEDKERGFKHYDWIVCVCYSSDGKLLCTVSRDKSVQIHDIAACPILTRRTSKRRTSGLNVQDITAALDDAEGKRHSREGSKERAGSKRHSTHGHHGQQPDQQEEETPPKKLLHEDMTFFAAFSHDNELVVTSCGWEQGNAIIFDIVSMDELMRIPHHDWVTSASFSPLGGFVLTTCRDKCARIWELPEGLLYGKALQADKDRKEELERERKEAEAGKKKLVISRKKQKELAEAAEREKLAEKLHAKELFKFPHQNWTLRATWSRDGKRICTASDTGCVHIFNAETGDKITRLDQQEQILDVQWGPVGDRKIIVSSTDGSARIYDGLQTLWKAAKPEKPARSLDW